MSDSRPKLGDILTRLQLVDDAQVQRALDHQKSTGKLFGESLLDLGFIGEDDLSWALSSQLGLPFIAVTPDMADPALLARFPAEFLVKNLVLPLLWSDSGLSVVLADPTDKSTISRLERVAGGPLITAAGTPTAIRKALEGVFGTVSVPGRSETGEPAAASPRAPASLSSPELASLVDRALTRDAVQVHLDPEGEVVRVRFRDAMGRLTDGGEFDADALRDLVQGLKHWLGSGSESTPGIATWGNAGGDPDALIPFRIVALTTEHGPSLTLDLEGMAPGGPDPELPPDDWARIEPFFEAPSGLLLAASPTRVGRTLLWQRLAARIEGGRGRCVALAPAETPVPAPLLRFQATPGRAAAAALARQEGIDVWGAMLEDLSALEALVESASRGRFVFAVVPGNGALGLLSRAMERGVSATALAGTLLGVTALAVLPGDEETPARAVSETLVVDRTVRRALQNGGGLDLLRQAAGAQNFREIATRARKLAGVAPAVIQDLDRNRYLEDAA
jgi:hypothetical protein